MDNLGLIRIEYLASNYMVIRYRRTADIWIVIIQEIGIYHTGILDSYHAGFMGSYHTGDGGSYHTGMW